MNDPMADGLQDAPKLLPKRPSLVTSPRVDGGDVVIGRGDSEHWISLDGVEGADLAAVLSAMDGTRDVSDLAREFPKLGSERVETLVQALDRQGFVDDAARVESVSGLEALFELEDLANALLYETLYKNIFWVSCQAAEKKEDLPLNVLYGLAIENYHFLFRESYFDAPVLCYVGNTKARLAMNAFYAEEYGHDELILKALNHIGISRDELADTMPLPETMALCNALAYWSNNDPLFFFTTLGILEGKDIKHDSFLEACERIGMDVQFTKPMRTHSDINLKGEHGSLTRKIFGEIPMIDPATMKRLRAQTHLFVELYDRFYSGIWQHYSTCTQLLRRVSAL